jgi:hypothetical protein
MLAPILLARKTGAGLPIEELAVEPVGSESSKKSGGGDEFAYS